MSALIYYRVPECNNAVRSYLWEDDDLAPEFPLLHGFLSLWRERLPWPVVSVRLEH